MTNRIKITPIMGYRWVWRLVTSDGHVANESAPFVDRDACEAEALTQGLPVIGLTKTARHSPSARVANDTPLWQFIRDSAENRWSWQRFDKKGRPLAVSGVVFFSQREAIDDAKAHGYVAPPGRGKSRSSE